jgi:hypothetical protein
MIIYLQNILSRVILRAAKTLSAAFASGKVSLPASEVPKRGI